MAEQMEWMRSVRTRLEQDLRQRVQGVTEAAGQRVGRVAAVGRLAERWSTLSESMLAAPRAAAERAQAAGRQHAVQAAGGLRRLADRIDALVGVATEAETPVEGTPVH